MGLKTKKYEVEELGIVLTDAYAQIERLSVDMNGDFNCIVKIQKTRDDMDKSAIEELYFSGTIDRSRNVFEQAYKQIKDGLLKDWKDDIVSEGE